MRNAKRSATHTCLQITVALAVLSLLVPVAQAQSPENEIAAMMDLVNAQLDSDGAGYRVAIAEYVTGDPEAAGNTVIAKNVGNKQLSADFVPGDGRRAGWSLAAGTAITYAIDTTGDAVPPSLTATAAQTDAAIVQATNSWDALRCSNLGLTRNNDFGIDIGVIAFLNSLGGSSAIVADVQHAGWRDINFGGGVLGATFTFIFVSGGNPTDIDNNGKADTAFREIYYDPAHPAFLWPWTVDFSSPFDVESVAAHEIGHALSQAHFGKVFIDKKGNLKHAPRAVMNAAYTGPQRALLGTDNGGHCSNLAQWPNN